MEDEIELAAAYTQIHEALSWLAAQARVVTELKALKNRLEMFAHDIRVYGEVLAAQRCADLAATTPGFLARYRPR